MNMKWTKKPITVAAVQYMGDTDELPYEMGVDITRSVKGGSCFIDTPEGVMECKVGDWIIRGVKGEFYPCKPDIFEMTYMPAIGFWGDKEVEDVRTFHKKFDILSNDKPAMLTKRKLQERIECMQEELDEFKKAVNEQNFLEQADALIDLVYFAKGTAVMMGLPWAALWDDVQRANLSKERGVGKRGHAVVMIKPEGWQGPMTGAILNDAGYRLHMWIGDDGTVDEELCADDAFRKATK
jgi:predicted HAD superfamily Cof-like phosphohydrolase